MNKNINFRCKSWGLNLHMGRSAFSDFVLVIDCDIEVHKFKIVLLQNSAISYIYAIILVSTSQSSQLKLRIKKS